MVDSATIVRTPRPAIEAIEVRSLLRDTSALDARGMELYRKALRQVNVGVVELAERRSELLVNARRVTGFVAAAKNLRKLANHVSRKDTPPELIGEVLTIAKKLQKMGDRYRTVDAETQVCKHNDDKADGHVSRLHLVGADAGL